MLFNKKRIVLQLLNNGNEMGNQTIIFLCCVIDPYGQDFILCNTYVISYGSGSYSKNRSQILKKKICL